jgi:hypothetical protein
MSTPTTEPVLDRRAADYLDEVRSHLADLPADERDDLLEDLEAHVHEVAAATDAPLSDALGPPAAFAAELRASAGLGSRPVTDDRGWVARRLDRVAGRAEAVRRHPWTRAVVTFLPELRPAWWVARGWLLVYLAGVATGGDGGWFPLPELLGNAFLGLVATVPAVVWSVRLGRSQVARSWRRTLNALAVLGALLAWDQLDVGDPVPSPDTIYVIEQPVLPEPRTTPTTAAPAAPTTTTTTPAPPPTTVPGS